MKYLIGIKQNVFGSEGLLTKESCARNKTKVDRLQRSGTPLGIDSSQKPIDFIAKESKPKTNQQDTNEELMERDTIEAQTVDDSERYKLITRHRIKLFKTPRNKERCSQICIQTEQI
jgi:hypothetical protein